MKRRVAFFIAVAVVIGMGIIHGLWTDRWAFSAEPEASAAKLSRVPMNMGEWKGRPLEIDPVELDRGGIVNYIGRSYLNSRTKSQVQMILVCGRAGPISAHTPDVCFEGAGFKMKSAPERFSPPCSPSDSFWQTTFVKERTESRESDRVFWSWGAAGHWQIPDHPRLTFARYPALFKLYLSRQLSRPDEPLDGDPCQEFMGLLLPELKRCLFPQP